MKEVFKPIITAKQDYTGFYEVSDFGKVKSLEREVIFNNGTRHLKERLLKLFINTRGYYFVILSKDGKPETCATHLIEWDAHSKVKRNGFCVDHIDENKLNNMFWNFQLLTNRQNISKNHLANKNGSSKYVGVAWDKKAGKWKSQIYINGKSKHLGNFTNELEASKVYQNKLKEIGG